MHAAQRRRHVAGRDALREALDHRRLADAGFAGEDRVVLAPAHQHVDDLADFLVAAEDRIHLAGLGLRGEVLREAVERRRALRPCASAAPGVPAARSPEPSIGRRFSSSEPAQIVRCSLVSASTLILSNSCEMVGEGAPQFGRFQSAGEDMAGADLRLAEQQRRIVPAAIEQVDHDVGDAGHLGLVLAKSVDDARDIGSAAWRDRA